MKARTELIIAGVGAGAAAVTYAIKRILGEKRFRTMPYGYGIKLKRAITVDRPPEDLYQYWRNLENVAALSGGLLSMKIIDRTRSQWTLLAPGGMELRWTAEIMVDRPNKMIGWRSIGRGDIDNAGYLQLFFHQAVFRLLLFNVRRATNQRLADLTMLFFHSAQASQVLPLGLKRPAQILVQCLQPRLVRSRKA